MKTKIVTNLNKFLDNNPEFHGLCGDELQEQYEYVLVGHTGEVFYADGYSWRGWGAAMAAYMNSKDIKGKYVYMEFYMRWTNDTD